jgi:hypothetical protein
MPSAAPCSPSAASRNFPPNDTVVSLEQRMGFETVRNEVGHLGDMIAMAVMQKS